jgi:hypothetical protein
MAKTVIKSGSDVGVTAAPSKDSTILAGSNGGSAGWKKAADWKNGRMLYSPDGAGWGWKLVSDVISFGVTKYLHTTSKGRWQSDSATPATSSAQVPAPWAVRISGSAVTGYTSVKKDTTLTTGTARNSAVGALNVYDSYSTYSAYYNGQTGSRAKDLTAYESYSARTGYEEGTEETLYTSYTTASYETAPASQTSAVKAAAADGAVKQGAEISGSHISISDTVTQVTGTLHTITITLPSGGGLSFEFVSDRTTPYDKASLISYLSSNSMYLRQNLGGSATLQRYTKGGGITTYTLSGAATFKDVKSRTGYSFSEAMDYGTRAGSHGSWAGTVYVPGYYDYSSSYTSSAAVTVYSVSGNTDVYTTAAETLQGYANSGGALIGNYTTDSSATVSDTVAE